LQEDANRGKGVADETTEAEAGNDRRSISVESALGTIVAKGDDKVDPDAPIHELQGGRQVSNTNKP
jgi:hypothetical protein